MACMNEALQLTNVRSPAPAEFALLQAGAEEEPINFQNLDHGGSPGVLVFQLFLL